MYYFILITVFPIFLGRERVPDVKNKTPTVCKNQRNRSCFRTLPHIGFPCILWEENLRILCKCIQDFQSEMNLVGTIAWTGLGQCWACPSSIHISSVAEVMYACPLKPAHWDIITHVLLSWSLHVQKACWILNTQNLLYTHGTIRGIGRAKSWPCGDLLIWYMQKVNWKVNNWHVPKPWGIYAQLVHNSFNENNYVSLNIQCTYSPSLFCSSEDGISRRKCLALPLPSLHIFFLLTNFITGCLDTHCLLMTKCFNLPYLFSFTSYDIIGGWGLLLSCLVLALSFHFPVFCQNRLHTRKIWSCECPGD